MTSPPTSWGGRLFRSTLVNGAARLITIAVTLVVVPIHLRGLGVEAYGVWVLVASFSLTGGFANLADAGLQTALVKYVAEADDQVSPGRIATLLATATRMLMGLGLVAGGVIAVLAIVGPSLLSIPEELQGPLRLLLALTALETTLTLPTLAAQGYLEGRQYYGALRAIDVGRAVVFAVSTVVVLRSGGGLVAFGLAVVGANVLARAATVVAAHRRLGTWPLPVLRPVSADAAADSAGRTGLLGFGGWLFASKVSGTTWRHADKSILAVLASTALLSTYDVANRIQGAAAAVLSFTALAVVPASSELASKGDHERLREMLVTGTRYTLALSLPTVIGIAILTPEILAAWLDTSLEGAVGATRLFLVYQLFVSSVTVALAGLIGVGRAKEAAKASWIGLTVNLITSLALVPSLGLFGVIWGTLVGYAVSTSVYLRLVSELTGLRLREFLHGAYVPLLPWAAVFGAAVVLIRETLRPDTLVGLAFTLAAAGLLYVCGVVAFVLSAGERARIRRYLTSR